MINANLISLEICNSSIYEVQGDPDTIIREKLKEAGKGRDGFVMIEDTSLFFEAWGSLPGPYM